MVLAEMSGRVARSERARAITCGLTTILTIGLISVGGQAAWSFAPRGSDQTKPSAKSPQEKRAARKARELKAAAKQKMQRDVPPVPPADLSKFASPKRPARTVIPPTMTPGELDDLVSQYLSKNSPKVEPAARTSDVEFVRRVYFDVIGKPPTSEQVQSFVRDRAKDKRSKLIDALLGSSEYALNWARYWRDVIKFHSTAENPVRVRYDSLEAWLAKEFKANKPWDEIAAGLITAAGRNDENGAVGFSLAYDAQPAELAGEVSRVFLGLQIQCAQCHDHKTDSWKRQQFHEFAAFFAGMRPRQVVPGSQQQLPVFAVVPQGPRRYTMPDKDNPTKQIPVAPRFFLSSSRSNPEPVLPEALPPVERRAMAASYVTAQDNPWFARAFVTRIWYALLGESFYDPIDDIGPERTAKGAQVLEPLAEQWQKGGYDINWLFRTILNTESYQRRVRSTANAAGKTPFASNCPSRMRSDQVFDALVQALALPLDANGNLIMRANPAARANVQMKNALLARGLPTGAAGLGPADPRRTKNAALSNAEAKKAAQAAGLGAEVAKKAAMVQRMGGPRFLFDRLFGIDPSMSNDDVMGSIPQALFLMNSPLVNNRIQARPGTVLGEILTSTFDNRAALEALYLRVLSRQPTTREVEICGHYLASVGDRREAFEDIYWSLINSTEFLTRR
jgi:hypothetical protein